MLSITSIYVDCKVVFQIGSESRSSYSDNYSRPRHFEFRLLQIGTYQFVASGDDPSNERLSRLKIIFTTQKFVYEYELPSRIPYAHEGQVLVTRMISVEVGSALLRFYPLFFFNFFCRFVPFRFHFPRWWDWIATIRWCGCWWTRSRSSSSATGLTIRTSRAAASTSGWPTLISRTENCRPVRCIAWSSSARKRPTNWNFIWAISTVVSPICCSCRFRWPTTFRTGRSDSRPSSPFPKSKLPPPRPLHRYLLKSPPRALRNSAIVASAAGTSSFILQFHSLHRLVISHSHQRSTISGLPRYILRYIKKNRFFAWIKIKLWLMNYYLLYYDIVNHL